MHTFKVVRETHGWAVRVGEGMTTPFRSQARAIREANRLCDALRVHGEAAEVVIEGLDPAERPKAERLGAARRSVPLTIRRPVRP